MLPTLEKSTKLRSFKSQRDKILLTVVKFYKMVYVSFKSQRDKILPPGFRQSVVLQLVSNPKGIKFYLSEVFKSDGFKKVSNPKGIKFYGGTV